MPFSERVSVIIDVAADRAQAGINDFRNSVNEADGTVGRFRAGASSAFDTVRANAGALALGAGSALVAFGARAVGAFTDTARAAIELGDATGLTVEESSRWIAVADDMGVSATDLEGALGKIGKSLDAAKWESYGIATRDAAGQARSTNDIFLESLDMLGKITNETERARVGNELFGKSYASIAPMIGQTRDEYEDMLSTVESGQVITEGEAARAEEWRLAMDSLQDGLNEVVLAFGSFIAEQAGVVKGLAQLVEWGAKAAEALTGAGETGVDAALKIEKMADEFTAAGLDWVEFKAKVMSGAMDLQEALGILTAAQEADTSARDLATRQAAGYVAMAESMALHTDDVSEAFQTAANRAAGFEAEARRAEQTTRELDAAYQALTGQLNEEEAWLNLQENVRQFTWDMASGEQSADEQALAVNRLSQEILGYVADTETIPDEVKTDIISALQRGDLDTAIALINSIPRSVTVSVRGQIDPSLGNLPRSGAYASGTDAANSSGMALVGEHGPELMYVPRGTEILNNTETNQALSGKNRGGTYIDNRKYEINMPSGSRVTQRDLKRWNQINYEL